MKKILAIDAGNTRVKWGVHDGQQWTAQSALAISDIDALKPAFSALPRCDAIVIANVAGDAARDAITAALVDQPQPIAHWITSVKTQCGVTNLYETPAQLGVDRWAALIGARHLYEGALIVANAGTALTVDMLTADGKFLGGIIVPGFDLMHEALASRAAALKNVRGTFQNFPKNTQDAMTSGAWHALAGAIERMARLLEDETRAQPTLVLSGGDAQTLATMSSRFETRQVENLVLEGLVVIANASAGA